MLWFMQTNEEFRELCERVIEHQGHNRLLMGMSLGADAVAMLIECHKTGIFDFEHSVFYYFSYGPITPPWHKVYKKYLEEKFGIKIIELPGPNYTYAMSSLCLQDPLIGNAHNELRGTEHEFFPIPMDEMKTYVKKASNIGNHSLHAVGMKVGDSVFRRKYLKRTFGMDVPKESWFPIWSMEKGDLVKPFEEYGVKVNFDYELFGQSWELAGWSVFDLPVYDRCPRFRAQIEEYFPQFEMAVKRWRHYYPERTVKRDGLKKLQFKKRGLIMDFPKEEM